MNWRHSSDTPAATSSCTGWPCATASASPTIDPSASSRGPCRPTSSSPQGSCSTSGVSALTTGTFTPSSNRVPTPRSTESPWVARWTGMSNTTRSARATSGRPLAHGASAGRGRVRSRTLTAGLSKDSLGATRPGTSRGVRSPLVYLRDGGTKIWCEMGSRAQTTRTERYVEVPWGGMRRTEAVANSTAQHLGLMLRELERIIAGP